LIEVLERQTCPKQKSSRIPKKRRINQQKPIVDFDISNKDEQTCELNERTGRETSSYLGKSMNEFHEEKDIEICHINMEEQIFS